MENYHISATLAYFLLLGEGGRYRKGFVEVLDAVHRIKERRDSFQSAFAEVEPEQMEREWLEFVKALPIEEK